jgi:hypothetical protein
MADPRLNPHYVLGLVMLLSARDRQYCHRVFCSRRFRGPQSRQQKDKWRRVVNEYEVRNEFGSAALLALQQEVAELRARQPGRPKDPKHRDADPHILAHMREGWSATQSFAWFPKNGWGEDAPTIGHVYDVRRKARKKAREALRRIEQASAEQAGG